MKQIARVLEAVNDGCRTSAEVSEVTGLPLKHCSAWLRALVADGILTTGKMAPRRFAYGAPPRWYEPKEGIQ